MFFNFKNSDSDNSSSNLFNMLSEYKMYVFMVVGLIIFFVMIIIFFGKGEKEENIEYFLTLKGEEYITISQGEKYIEPGYTATNSKGEDITDDVVVKKSLNINRVDEYEIRYIIGDVTKKRIVNVVAKEEFYIELESVNDSTTVYLNIGEEYIEPGYKGYSNYDKNLNDKVKIESNLDINKAGKYTITYRILENEKVLQSTERKVIVVDNAVIKLSLNTNLYVNNSVDIKVEVVDEYFDYLILPNGNKVSLKNYSYKVSENGTYKFTSYNKINGKNEQTIEVKNIDKIKPTGSCNGSYNGTISNINVSSADNVGIEKYVMNNVVYTGDKIVVNGKISNANIIVYDKAGNYNTISCSISDDSYLPVIKPLSNETIVKMGETEKLKVYITKKSNYYITRVWMYNPYMQLNKFDSPEYGVNLYKPSDLLQKAIDKNNLDNKLIMGFNASGFYLKDTFDASSVSKYPGYDKTSVGTLVITNGKVVRNAYDKAYKTWYTVGVDKNNKLQIFTDLKSNDVNEKKIWANNVINSGIRNTFTFASPLIIDGVKSDVTTNMPSISSKLVRQAICQVNKNNFVLITGSDLDRTDLINIMLGLNCQTGTNLDGGGSVALLFKEKNSETIQVIYGNGRKLSEVGYITE